MIKKAAIIFPLITVLAIIAGQPAQSSRPGNAIATAIITACQSEAGKAEIVLSGAMKGKKFKLNRVVYYFERSGQEIAQQSDNWLVIRGINNKNKLTKQYLVLQRLSSSVPASGHERRLRRAITLVDGAKVEMRVYFGPRAKQKFCKTRFRI